MDFQSLRQGAPFYALHQGGDRPRLAIGIVQNKPEPKPQYMSQNPGAFTGTNLMKQVVEIVVRFDKEDVPFQNLDPTASSATYNNGQTFIATTADALLPAVDEMMARSRKRIAERPYDDAVMEEGEKMLETLNPRYREEKEQKQDIANLKEQVGGIYSTMNKMMEMMQSIQKGASASKSK